MNRSIFGWDLPPGCTMKDIDNAFGDRPDELEDFITECHNKPGMLSKEELQMLEDIWNGKAKEYPVEKLQELFYQVLSWSFQRGIQQGIEDEKEGQTFNTMNGDK